MPLRPESHLRIARHSRDLPAAERFWVHGVGLNVLWRSPADDRDEHDLVMVGWPGASWHLELVADPDGASPTAPTEDLLVLYVGAPADPDLLDRLTEAGGTRVTARNPYWEQWGSTFADPDGYRLVLSSRTWG